MTDLPFTIYGVSGKSNAGKDVLVKQVFRPNGFMPFSLAWHFKMWLIGTKQATYEELFVTKPPHIRDLMQQEGTTRGRMIYGDTIWCETMMAWFHTLHAHAGITKFIIADVRFPSEKDFITQHGGKVFRVHAPNRVAQSNLTPELRSHISETALDTVTDFDGIIYNEIGTSVDSLWQQVHTLLSSFGVS